MESLQNYTSSTTVFLLLENCVTSCLFHGLNYLRPVTAKVVKNTEQNGYEVDTRFSGARVCVSLFQTETKRTTVILFKTKSRTSWSGSGKTKVFEKTPSLGLSKNKLSVVGCE